MRVIHSVTALTIVLAACSPATPADVIIDGVALVDGMDRSGGVATVVIRDGLISDIMEPDRGASIEAAVRLDGSGKTLIPGLWDTHVHLESTTADAGRCCT